MGLAVAAPVYAERLQVGLSVSPRSPGQKDLKVVTVPRPILSPVGLAAFGRLLAQELCPRTNDPRIDFHIKVADGLALDSAAAAVLFPDWCFDTLLGRPPEQWTPAEIMAMVIVGGLIAATPGWPEAIRRGSVRARLDTADPTVTSILLSFKRPLHPRRLLAA